ncbi:DUF721 domain-containing protein [Candidatus Clavichlamydia salmonicola]|uniref:DUF721 domain-containing protein n=1 Tax=Candidatus Clavichlamydia salmonicola TaxID=469812 RepID=UPI001891C7E1|nr:DUF721 domain-containing protein [Candidatus Clavichlamydia salmonicola]
MSFPKNKKKFFKNFHRTGNYDQKKVTSKHMSDVAEKWLDSLKRLRKTRPDLILAAWPRIVGPEMAVNTQAVSFLKGILTVKVKNSVSYSILQQYDKQILLKSLCEEFPELLIESIQFRLG